MILTPEKLELQSEPFQQTNVELPPPYTSTPIPNPSCNNEHTSYNNASSSSLPPRTNYLSVNRLNTNLKGIYVIDPCMTVPQSVMAPLEEGEERKNLLLTCRNGTINSDIWLVGEGSHKATMDVKNQNGYITVKLHADNNQAFDLAITSINGGVTLAVPQSYQGTLTTTTVNGWVSISSALAPRITTFSDVKSTRKCFIGDFGLGYGKEQWDGSSINIDCRNARVKLCYVDEVQENGDRFLSGILGKFLGARVGN